MSGRQRKSPSFADLIRTLVVFGVLIGAFVALLPKHKQQAVRPVDYATDLSIFVRAAGYPVQLPQPVPTGWTVTSFRGFSTRDGKTPSTMHMGMVTSMRKYAALEETNGDSATWIALQTQNATEVEPGVTVAGVQWREFQRKAVVSLVRTSGNVTTVLTGGAGLQELEDLARNLVTKTA